MDDESETDLYGDLLPFNRKHDKDFKTVDDANANLRHENEQLKQQIERLTLENRALTQDKKKLETNFSSLLKTAQTEMKRKDQTIAELRREKDSVVFRRGRGTRYDNRPQERNHPEPRHEAQRPDPIEQPCEPVSAPKPFSQPVEVVPVVEEVTPVVIAVAADKIAVSKVQDADKIPEVPKLVPKSNAVPQTLFSKRHSSAVNKQITETIVPTENALETVRRVDKPLASSGVSTPEINPETKIKKRITPVMISEPAPRVVDQNKNKLTPPAMIRDVSTLKVVNESRSKTIADSEVTTPKAPKAQAIREVPNIEPVKISKSKIVTHVNASYDTSNAKTKDFKRRVSTVVKDTTLEPESVPKSKPKQNPSFISENSSDGLRKPSNYDLMKRNIKHKYHSLDSPKKSDRSRRSRSRSVWASRRRDRSRSSHRLRSERKSGARRKDCSNREDETFKQHSPSRRQSKAERSPVFDSKRDSSPARRRDDLSKRKVPSYNEIQNFSPKRSSTAKKDSEKKSSRDRSLLDSRVPSTSKSKVRLEDSLEKSVGNVTSADKLNPKEVETAINTSKITVAEPLTETSAKPVETVRKVPSSPCTTKNVTSPSKQPDSKRKSIEAVADSLAMKLTSTQTTETTTKTVQAITLEAALRVTNVEPAKAPETQPTNFESPTKTKISDVISALTNNVMPIPPKDFLTARMLADYKTPTASAENSTEVSQGKTMSPPDVPKPKSGHAPTSFSGIKLGGEPKHFSYPFTPMKVDIANEYISFPSMITPLKATPVKANYIEEDSLDLLMRLQLAKNKDQLVSDNAMRVERTVTRTESEIQWKLHTLDSSDSANTMDAEKPKDLEGNVDKTVPDKTVPDKSVSVSDEIIKEVAGKGTRDMEDGEITDDTNPMTPEKPEKTMVTFFKKSKETKAKRTRLADVKKVVSPNKMNDLRQKLQARTECVAPPRKDVRDYEIRLKSPYKTSPRKSSASGANRSLKQDTLFERLTYNDYPPKSSHHSRSPECREALSHSRSPTSMFLEKSPERFESKKPGPMSTSQEKHSQHRSRSPKASDKVTRENDSHGTRHKQHPASSSRSRSPCDLQREKPDPHRTTSPRKGSSRLSASVSHSRSPSPKPRSARKPRRLESISQSRSKSPLTSCPDKPADKSDRYHSSTRKRGSRSRSKSPLRETRNGPSNINNHIRRLATEKTGGEFPFDRRRSRYVVDEGRQDRPAGHSKRRSRSKSRSRSSSPIKTVQKRSEGRHSRSQESPKKVGRERESSASPSPARTTKVVPVRNNKRLSQSQGSPKKAERERDRSDSPSSDRSDDRIDRDNSARPFRRRRAVIKTDPTIRQRHASPEKVNDQMKLIERILDSDSGISEKNISPVSKSKAGTSTPDRARDEAYSHATSPSKNLPDILSTLDSNLSQIKSLPAPTESSKPKSLDEFVSNLIQNANPELQRCLDSVRANFAPPPVVIENEKTQPTNNGFVGRKRRITRILPPETPLAREATKQSPVKPSEPVPEPQAVHSSEVIPEKPCDPVPKQTGSLPSENKPPAGSQSFSQASSAQTNGFPFGRRRRTVRILPQSETTSPNPKPTKETIAPLTAQSLNVDPGCKSDDKTPTKPSEIPILAETPTRSVKDNDCHEMAGGMSSSQQSPQSGCEQNADSERGKRTAKRKRDDSDEKPWKKRNGNVVSNKVVERSEFERKAKSLFGTDTEEEEEEDFTVRNSEYAKMDEESSDDDLYESEQVESEDSDDEWKPARSHARKVPETSPPQVPETSPPQVQRIWPEKPAEPKRRTTVFLDELPKSSEMIIAKLMSQVNRTMSGKKKKRRSVKANPTSKAPKSAEFVPTDDSD